MKQTTSLNQQEIQKICKDYNLGKFKSMEELGKGIVNYNYELRTDKGIFIIRILGKKIDEYKKKSLKLEFGVLDFLTNNKFDFKTPFPIENKNKEKITHLKDKDLWIYKKIEGDSVEEIDTIKLKEMVNAIAKYHKIISKFKFNNKTGDDRWLLQEYDKLEKIKPKNKIDKLMLDNLDFFKAQFNAILNKKFNTNLLPTHSDFNKNNFLFEKNKVVAILDFDNVEICPRIRDVAYFIKTNCLNKRNFDEKKMKMIIEEYEKMNKLSKEEKDMIIPCIIKDNCKVFWWFYAGMKKSLDKRESFLNWTIDSTKQLLKLRK